MAKLDTDKWIGKVKANQLKGLRFRWTMATLQEDAVFLPPGEYEVRRLNQEDRFNLRQSNVKASSVMCGHVVFSPIIDADTKTASGKHHYLVATLELDKHYRLSE